MTSKTSFSKLLKEHMRHRLGVTVITCVYFLFALMFFVITIQNSMAYEGWTRAEVYATVLNASGPNSLLILCAALGALTAICGFAYLHSRTKIDFFHSLPVKRKDMFRVITANSFLVFAAGLLVSTVIEAVITVALGYFTGNVVSNLLLAILCNLLAFAAAFFTAALAMIMTGNVVVGVLGTAVFVTWAPVLIKYALLELPRIFFFSYVEPPAFMNYFDYGSPVYLAVRMQPAASGWNLFEKLPVMAVVCVWIIALAVLCQYLFDIRPSETAGKAMAFPKINPVIRILLVIPAALYTGSYLYSLTLSSSKIWIVIGIVFGTVLFHGIIECIYQFDIRGMWSHWKQMLATMAVVLCLTGSFYLDLYGYDSYVPAAGGVSSVMVEDDGFTYRKEYFWGDSEQSITGKDMENVLALIKDAVKEERQNRFPGGPEQATDGAVTDSSPTIYYTDNGANAAEQEGRKYVGVTYYMKNGETIKRRFDMSDVQANAIMEAACHSESFRKSVYSLYTADWSKIKSISWNSFIENQNLRLTEEEQKQFLTIYLSELDTLDYETMRTVLPVAELNIEHEVEDRMDFTNDFYYIYPSFTKTLAFLESKGCAVDRTLADINITQIDVNDYTGDEPKNWTVTDPAIIQSVKGKLTISNSNFTYYSSGYEGESPTPDYDITVYYNEGYGENTLNVWTDAETLKTLTAGESGE